MAFRIGELIVSGELRNSRRNSVHGWLDFGNDRGIRLELTGNLAGELAGRNLRFEAHPVATPDEAALETIHALEFRQIGVVANVELRTVRTVEGPLPDYAALKDLGPAAFVEKTCLYLEWYSQNGRVVAEIVEPVFDDGDGDDALTPTPLPSAEETGLAITGLSMSETGEIEEIAYFAADDADEDDDPYELFPGDLENELRESNREADPASTGDASPAGLRPWDEVIPGIDEATKAMYEQWDEVLHGEKDEPLATLFDPPIALKPPAQIVDEQDAENWLTLLLSQLALRSVAVDVCEHFTARETYRWLLEEILPEAHVHPNLRPSGYVVHYSTFEDCPQCEAEFDAEFEQRKPGE